MKIGDKIKFIHVNGTQYIGEIIKETKNTWTIQLPDGNFKRINKTVNIGLIEEEKIIEKQPIKNDKKCCINTIPLQLWIWILLSLGIAVFSILTFFDKV